MVGLLAIWGTGEGSFYPNTEESKRGKHPERSPDRNQVPKLLEKAFPSLPQEIKAIGITMLIRKYRLKGKYCCQGRGTAIGSSREVPGAGDASWTPRTQCVNLLLLASRRDRRVCPVFLLHEGQTQLISAPIKITSLSPAKTTQLQSASDGSNDKHQHELTSSIHSLVCLGGFLICQEAVKPLLIHAPEGS